jgi:hypothetical protein
MHEVVNDTALNTKWIPMVLNGFFDSGDGPMLSFDFVGGKVMVDKCLASSRMELALALEQENSGVAKKNRCLALGFLGSQ